MHLSKVTCLVAIVCLIGLCGCDKKSVFFSAISQGDRATVSRMLKKDPTLVDAVDEFGDIGMGRAVESFDLDMIKILTDAGSKLDYDGVRTGIPLVYIAYFGDNYLEIVEYFLDQGADPNIQSILKHTHGNGTPLHNAANHAQVETVRLLIGRGANVNEPNILSPRMPYVMQSALHPVPLAVKERREILRLLLEAGADPNVRSTVYSQEGESLVELSKKHFNGENLFDGLEK